MRIPGPFCYPWYWESKSIPWFFPSFYKSLWFRILLSRFRSVRKVHRQRGSSCTRFPCPSGHIYFHTRIRIRQSFILCRKFHHCPEFWSVSLLSLCNDSRCCIFSPAQQFLHFILFQILNQLRKTAFCSLSLFRQK